MGRTVAVVWHASFAIAAAVLYFLFVLPRWWELTDVTTHTLGTVLRVVMAAVLALAALPVVFTLLRTRKPEYGTPQLALTLRTWSVVGHVLAGVLIAGTAVSEIWLSLDDAGQWLFAIYGAAAAVAVLAIAAFYLAFAAELPPPPPKPLKAKKPARGRKRADEATPVPDGESVPEAEAAEADAVEEPAEAAEADAAEEPAEAAEEPAQTAEDAEPAEVPVTEETPSVEEIAGATGPGGLRNRRPTGKTGRRRRSSPEAGTTQKRK